MTPGTAASAVLGWVTALLVVATVRTGAGRYRPLYLTGLVSHTLAFYWLRETIERFGGFSFPTSTLLYAAFVLLSSVQFVVTAFTAKYAPERLRRGCLLTAVAWTAGEALPVRIFPWHLGHTQLAFTPFAQGASLGGAPLLTFLMIWAAEGAWRLAESARFPDGEGREARRPKAAVVPLLLIAVTAEYGLLMLKADDGAGEAEVAVVQGNVTIEEKGDVRYFVANTGRYLELTKALGEGPALVVWPESVIQEPLWTRTRSVAALGNVPLPAPRPALLVGTLMYDFPDPRDPAGRPTFFNSALAVLPDGTTLPPYHKRILMPFGEYTPFAGIFPFLGELNPNASTFAAGDRTAVFDYPTRAGPLRAAPLICYEDVVPSLSREAVNAGADVLVNLTNDAWFGRTVAPEQHNLIASFRAIENHRPLVRSTNSGLTAVVLPDGSSAERLPADTEGTLIARVPILRYKTPYTRFVGDVPWPVLGAAAFVAAAFGALRRSRTRSRIRS